MHHSIRIALAEDHPILLESMRSFLQIIPDFEVVTAVSDGQALLDVLAVKPVDIVLLDLDMPVMDGRKALNIIRKKYKKSIRVIILSMHGGEPFIRKYMIAGANAYLDKGCDLNELVEAIHHVFEHNIYFPENVSDALKEEILRHDGYDHSTIEGDALTSREIEILQLLCNGVGTREVAEHLNLSMRTIENHRRKIYHKLGVNNTLAMLREAVKKGYYEMDL